MKKLNKLLSLLLVLALLVPMLNVASAEEVNPLLLYPLLTEEGKYFNIENSSISMGGVSDTVDFLTTIGADGNEVNQAATFSVVSTGNYTAGNLSWKTTRIVVAVDFFDPATDKMTRMGYQFRPDELIMANNATTTITINKEQAVAGIMDGMNAMNASLYALFPDSAAETRKAVAEAFENGCGLTINAEISKFYVPAGFESNRQLLVDAPAVGGTIWVIPQDNPTMSTADKLKRLRDWGASSPSFKNPSGFANDAITRAKYQAGNAAFCGIPPLKDLEVTGLTVDIDEPTGDITCEASVENSFLENLKNVQLEWILETPKGTIFKTETLEGRNILKEAQSFITKQKFTGAPQGQGGSCTFRINLKDPDTDRMTFEDGTPAVESDYTNNIGYAEFDPAEIDIQMTNLTATSSSSKTGSFSIKADYVLQSIVSDDTYANALVGRPLELVLSVGGVQTKKSVAFDAGLTGTHTFNISGIPVPPVGTRSYQVEAWINHPDATDMEIDKDITDVKARNNYMTTMISTEGAAPPPIPPTSVCIQGKSVGYELRYIKRTCQGSSCTYHRTKKSTRRTTVYSYKYTNIDKSYTHAGTSTKTVDIVQAGVIAPTVRYNGNTPVFRSGYWHTPYVVTMSKVTHEDNSTITLPGFGTDQNVRMTTSLSETAGAEGSKPSLKLERVYRRSIYELGGKEQKGGETVSIPDTLIGPVSVNLPSPVGKAHDWKEEDIRCTILGGSRSGNMGTCEPTNRMNEMYNYPQDYVDPAAVRTWRAEGIGSSGSGGSGQEVYYSEAVDVAVYMPPVLSKASDMYTTTGNPQSITMADLKQNKSIISLMSKIDGKTASTSNHKDKLKNEILAAILKGVKDNRVVHINYKERDGEYTYNITGDCGMGGSTKFQLEGSVFDDIN